MNLARWQQLDTDWVAIENELANCLFSPKITRTPECVVLDMWIDGNILDYPSLGGGVMNNTFSLMDQLNKHKRELGLPLFPANSRVVWGSYSHNGPRHRYQVYVYAPVQEYCEQTKRPCVLKENTEILSFVAPRPHCWFWQHEWELIPDVVRSTGLNFLFFSSGIQKGIRRCKICDKRITMYREGVAGAGIDGGWKTCTAKKEAYIDSLPRL